MFNDDLDLGALSEDDVPVGSLYDSNGDGIADYASYETSYDLNGDGLLDDYSESIDSNLDGIVDYQQDFVDTNGDSILDTEYTSFDQNGDGIFDTQQIFTDTNEDGYVDDVSQYSYTDADGDGYVDTISFTEDTNADGYFDVYSVSQDLDMDGIFDTIVSNQLNYNPGFDPTASDPSAVLPDDSGASDADNFDPTVDSDGIVGDPADAMESWHVQETDSSCAVCAQEFVLEDLLGQDFTEEELRDLAYENGWWDESGTSPDNVGKLLEYYGLNVDRHEGGSLEEIEQALANGGSVIVGVDAGEIWYNQDDVYAPGDDCNHAVEVIGIDYSDPDNPMVILNDSGTSNGAGEMIPLDQFMGAWEDGNNFIVTATE